MNNARFAGLFSLAILFALYFRCTNLTGGAGGETTNGYVQGFLFNEDGTPASKALVRILPKSYNPVIDPPIPPSSTGMTSASGMYNLATPIEGAYTIEAVDSARKVHALITGISVAKKDTAYAPLTTLRIPGAIKVMLPDNVDAVNGYVYIPGTSIAGLISGRSGFVLLDTVPAGTITDVDYAVRGGSGSFVIRYGIRVLPGDTVTLENPAWKYAKEILLNTAASGAQVSGNVTGFPVLVRLTQNNFTFSEAGASGNDIRFTKADNSPLPYEIERWDAVNRLAEVWVRADTVYGNDSAQFMMMFWGNPDAAAGSNPRAVFDTSGGFQGVWHLAKPDNEKTLDATANRYDGTMYGIPEAGIVPGIIGQAMQFDGSTSYVRMLNTASSKLNFPENGTYAVSAWVCLSSPVNSPGLIVGKGHSQYYLRNNYYSGNHYWEFVEYHDANKQQYISDIPATTASAWKYLVGIRSGNRQRIFLDGDLVVDSARTYPYTLGVALRDTTFDLSMGKHLETTDEGLCYLKGKVDEVRISNNEYSSDWVKLCYMNQRADDKLVTFR